MADTNDTLVQVQATTEGGEFAGRRFHIGKSKVVWGETRWTSRKKKDRVRIGRTEGDRHIVKTLSPETLVTLEDA